MLMNYVVLPKEDGLYIRQWKPKNWDRVGTEKLLKIPNYKKQ